MRTEVIEDFSKATACPQMQRIAPIIKEIPPDVLQHLWEKLPKGPISKTKLFAVAVAMTLQSVNQGMNPK